MVSISYSLTRRESRRAVEDIALDVRGGAARTGGKRLQVQREDRGLAVLRQALDESQSDLTCRAGDEGHFLSHEMLLLLNLKILSDV